MTNAKLQLNCCFLFLGYTCMHGTLTCVCICIQVGCVVCQADYSLSHKPFFFSFIFARASWFMVMRMQFIHRRCFVGANKLYLNLKTCFLFLGCTCTHGTLTGVYTSWVCHAHADYPLDHKPFLSYLHKLHGHAVYSQAMLCWGE